MVGLAIWAEFRAKRVGSLKNIWLHYECIWYGVEFKYDVEFYNFNQWIPLIVVNNNSVYAK